MIRTVDLEYLAQNARCHRCRGPLYLDDGPACLNCGPIGVPPDVVDPPEAERLPCDRCNTPITRSRMAAHEKRCETLWVRRVCAGCGVSFRRRRHSESHKTRVGRQQPFCSLKCLHRTQQGVAV